MKNTVVTDILKNCEVELEHINDIIDKLGGTSRIVPYLNKYSAIRACGTLEVAFKTLIADYSSKRSSKQIKMYINNKVRSSSVNPRYDIIVRILKEFDENWAEEFKNKVKSLPNKTEVLTSLESLIDARNEFAHGGSSTITFIDIQKYYNESKNIIIMLDEVL